MKKILIIDDETDICFLLKSHFILNHYQVRTANTLTDGLTTLQNFNPDILFLDNNLPDGYGWDAACKISENYPGIKINLITGQPVFDTEICDENFTIIEKPLSYAKVDTALE